MQRQRTILTLACLLLSGMTTWAQSISSEHTFGEVLVTGEHPGPGLWKVSKGDHVLWILGTPTHLSQDVTWRSEEVESIIASSQTCLTPGGVEGDVDAGFLKGIGITPTIGRVRSLPGRTTLQDILPPDTYSKWLVLLKRYELHPSVDRLRPTFAARSLILKARSHSGLRTGAEADVWDTLKTWARKHKLKITTTSVQEVEIKVATAKDVAEEFSRDPQAGVECFTRVIGAVEIYVDTWRALANAWRGDVCHRSIAAHSQRRPSFSGKPETIPSA